MPNRLRILCNSWPKAGTHILLDLAKAVLGEGSWYLDPDIKLYEKVTQDLEAEFLKRVDERIDQHGWNFAIKGHYPWTQRIEKGLLERQFSIYFIVRDPRDVILSTVRWLTDLRPHWQASHVMRSLETASDRTLLAIGGLPKVEPFTDEAILWEKPLPQRYERLTPWTKCSTSCVCTYEQLSGNRGPEEQRRSVESALAHVGLAGDQALQQRVVDEIGRRASATFHSGTSSGWEKDFAALHRKMFIDLGGEALVAEFHYKPTDLNEKGQSEWAARWQDVRSQSETLVANLKATESAHETGTEDLALRLLRLFNARLSLARRCLHWWKQIKTIISKDR